MPLIKIDHIISFSSEDSVHVASNILSIDTTKKWKCLNPGEKNAIVVLQLEKACVITGIDIGNEHSAYIEILVSRSGTDVDYKVLLVTSAFMTPLEARHSQNVNKVRMFSKDQLSKPECNEKWDRIKIVCTQPFNKHVQYGLSFVKLHTNENISESTPTLTKIGNFILRPESPDKISVGSLFAEWRASKQDATLTGAAAIREASSSTSLARYGTPVCKPKLKTTLNRENLVQSPKLQTRNESFLSKINEESEDDPQKKCVEETELDISNSTKKKPRNRNELLYNKDEEEPNEKIDKIIKKNIEKKFLGENEKASNKSKTDRASSSKKKDIENSRQHPLDITINSPIISKNKTETLGNNKKDKHHPLDVSINSPNVSNTKIDSKTSKLDSKRKNERTEGGSRNKKIKKDKVTKPFSKLLDGVVLVISGIQNPDRGTLRTLALSMGARYMSDWNDTCTHLICAFPNTPKFNQVRGKGKIVKRSWLEDCHNQRKRLPWRRYALDKNDIGKEESEDEICESIARISPVNQPIFDSNSEVENFDENKEEGSDTEERVARIKEMRKKINLEQNDIPKPAMSTDIYSLDTDEEVDLKKISSSSPEELVDLFNHKQFYIDHSFDDETYNKLLKYIMAYNGKPSDSPADDVDIIITCRENSQTLREINSKAKCVGPSWIWKCHNLQKLVSMSNYAY